MGFGKLLEKKMNEKRVKQAELAAAVGIPKTTLNSIIHRDNTKIEIEVFLKICDYLDCDPEEFYTDFKREKQIFEDNITQHERNIINAYRESSKDTRIAVCKILDVEIETLKATLIYRAASSEDNHPAEIIETDIDFSKIPPTDIKL